MSHKASSSQSSLNVLGCQWPGAEKPGFSKSTFLLSTECATRKSSGPNSHFSTFEEMDLKLENERRLQEMRELGKQRLVDRNEQNVREEGAANLLARFHSMQWIRQPHVESSAGTSQPNRPVDNSQDNLVPVKHGEEEYFPGTRQLKKTKRVKNPRPKYDIVKLEEMTPDPTNRILPACYQPAPTTNAWAVRKGSELFDGRKVSVTLYDTGDDSNVLLQRALDESMITLAQEQERIVNMYSSLRNDNQSSETAKMPKDVVESWDNEKGACTEGGASNASWLKTDCNGNRVSGSLGQIGSTTKSRDENSNYGLALPENSSYSGQRRVTKIHQEFYRSSDVLKTVGQAKGTYDSKASGDNQCSESSYATSCYQSKLPLRMDAGDCVYDRSQVDIKEKYKVVQNKPYLNKFKTDRNGDQGNCGKSYKEENKEVELESLGFSKSRQFAQREMTRKREDAQSRERSMPKSGGLSEQQEKLRRKGQSVPNAGGDNRGHLVPGNTSSRERHISFSDPLVLRSGKNERLNTCVSDSDEDPWLEPDERTESSSASSVYPIAHIQPRNPMPQRCPTPKQEDSSVHQSSNVKAKTEPGPPRGVTSLPTTKSPVRKTPTLEEMDKTLVKASEDKLKKSEVVELEESSEATKDSATSPGTPGSPSVGCHKGFSTVEDSVSCGTGDEGERMKKIREEIHFLDSRLKLLSTALENDGTAQHPSSERKMASPVTPERLNPARQTTPTPTPTEETKPTDVPLLNFWLQSVANQSPHSLVQPPTLPPIHPLAHSFSHHPFIQSLTHPLDHSMTHPQAHSQVQPQGHSETQTQAHPPTAPQSQLEDHPQIHPQIQPQMHPQIHPQIHPQVHPQMHPQIQPQVHPQIQPQVHPQIHPQGQLQAHFFPQILPHLQGYAQVHPQMHLQVPPQTLHGQPQSQVHPQVHPQGHVQPQHPVETQERAQPASSPGPEAFMAHLQGQQQLNSNMNCELPAQIAQLLAQQRQCLTMQGAAAAAVVTAAATGACPPGCAPNPMSLNWLGLRPTLSHNAGTWLSQMNPPPGMTAVPLVRPPSASAECSTTGSDPVHMTGHVNVETLGIEKTVVDNPLSGRELSAANNGSANVNQVPVAANSLLGNEFPTASGSAVQNHTCPSTSAVPAVEPGSAAYMQWFAQMEAFHLQQQQQMMQLASAVPGMHPSLPMQSLLPSVVPSAGGVSAPNRLADSLPGKIPPQYEQMMQLASAVPGMHPSLPMQSLLPSVVPSAGDVSAPNRLADSLPGKIPPQYEGDWIISPADEARLGQGLLLANEAQDSMLSSQGRQNIHGATQFTDAVAGSTGSVRALGLPAPTSLKPARPPAHLANLKQQNANAQMNIGSAVANTADILPQTRTHVVTPGVRTRGNGHPEEPRGRGRLR